ncbi:hypothetical protein IV203_033740 [Nitzschia inconspicua]|uniref:Uncharacterized protein n=1 Tax=Nitzschia inconspicua TaxID=303405 RepID=A0A9K3Q705_9STRA|nr:hypothetical protein IV203_033740 [Nitzschia inconspicua]
MANTNLVLDEIDVAAAALKVEKWTATLPFNGFLYKPTNDVLMASFQDCHDLFSLTQTMCKGFIVQFDPQTFPVVPGVVAKNKDSIKKLFDALMCSSHHYGFCQLVSHGQTKAGRRYLHCSNFQPHQQNTATKATVGELCPWTLVCDRKNSRGHKGQSLPKRTSTSKATTLEGTFDMATRKRIVSAAATHFQKTSANHNIGREFGLHLTRRQVAQMQQMAKLADDLTSTDELEDYKHLDSDTNRVFAYLKKKGATIVLCIMESVVVVLN